MRQLVDETLDDKQIVRGSDTTPPADDQARRHVMTNPLHLEIGDRIRCFGQTLDRVTVQPILAHGHRCPAAQYRATAGTRTKPGRQTVRVDHRGNAIVIHRPHTIVTNILLARPHHLERIANLFGKRHRLLDLVGFQTSTNAAAEILVMQHDLVFGQPRNFRGSADDARRHLRARPDLAFVDSHEDGRVQRFHRGMRQHRQLIHGIYRRAVGGTGADLFGDNRLAVERALRQRVAQLLRGEVGIYARIPLDIQRLQPLLRGPVVIADDCHRVAYANHVDHARHGARRLVINGNKLAGKRGAGFHCGDFHARHFYVQTELCGASDLVRRVDASQRLADQDKILGILERRNLVRHRQLASRCCQRTKTEAATAGRMMHNGTIHRAGRRIHLPLGGSGRNELHSRDRARFAQNLPPAPRARGTTGNLAAQGGHAVKLFASWRVFHLDLIEAHAKLFGQQHAETGIDALPHFHAGHYQAD